MTVNSPNSKAGPYIGDGSTTEFPFSFRILHATHIRVIKTDLAGAETTIDPNDYSVTFDDNEGEVTYNSLGDGELLTILRNMPFTQETDIANMGGFYPETHEDVFDILTMSIQQVKEVADRAVTVPPSDTTTSPKELIEELRQARDEAVAANVGILTNAGFIAVSTDLLGPDTIGIVAADLDGADTIGIVAANLTGDNDIGAVGANIVKVIAVADNETNINAVADNKTNIDAVAGNKANIDAVVGNATNINAVNANKANIDTVAGAKTNIDAVAGNATNINAVAGNATNINAVNANKTNIDAVATINSHVTTVAGIAANVTAVAGNATNINTVAGNSANVTTVAGIAANVTAVAGNATNINAVNANKTNIDAVAANGTNIATVAGMADDIEDVITNMAAIQDAPNQAALAEASAIAAAAVLESAMFRDVVFITAANSPFSITGSHNGKMISVDSSGGDVTINLPTISGLGLPFTVGIKKATSDGNTVTINRGGTDTIDGNTSKAISTPGAGTTLLPDTDPAPDQWVSADFGAVAGNIAVDTFTGNGSQTAFTLSVSPGSENNVTVNVGGVLQMTDDYSLSGSTLTLSEAPANGVPIEVRSGTLLPIGTPADGTVTFAKMDSGAIASKSEAEAGSASNKMMTPERTKEAIAAQTKVDFISGLIDSVKAQDYLLVVKAPYGGKITNTITKCVSGTATFTFKINSTSLGGTANSVSTAEQDQAHTSSNTFAAGDDIVITASSVSSCKGASFTIKFEKA